MINPRHKYKVVNKQGNGYVSYDNTVDAMQFIRNLEKAIKVPLYIEEKGWGRGRNNI